MKTEQLQKSLEVDTNQFELIKGDFSPEYAKDILNHLISKKINFHDMKNFSSQIRSGESDHSSIKRAQELIQTRQSVNDLINAAEEMGKTLRIKSNITIELI